jgi:hypothetical protein
MKNTEKVKKPQGQISMILHKGGEYDPKTGKIINGEIIDTKEVKNLIVDKASELMASRLAPASTYYGSTLPNAPLDPNVDDFLLHGLQYLAIGVGILVNPLLPYDRITNPVDTAQWDILNPPAATLAATKLQTEIARKAFTSWSFVKPDGSDSVDGGGNPVPTNVLKLVTTFMESEAVGPLTEMGIFGGNAQAFGNNGEGKDSGYMFNYKTMSVWSKDASSRLTISWLLTF